MLMPKDNARAGNTLSRSLGTLSTYWLLLVTFELALSTSQAIFLLKTVAVTMKEAPLTIQCVNASCWNGSVWVGLSWGSLNVTNW